MAQITPPPSLHSDAADLRVVTPGVPPELAAAATAVVLHAVSERPVRPVGRRSTSAWERTRRGLRTTDPLGGGWGGFTA